MVASQAEQFGHAIRWPQVRQIERRVPRRLKKGAAPRPSRDGGGERRRRSARAPAASRACRRRRSPAAAPRRSAGRTGGDSGRVGVDAALHRRRAEETRREAGQCARSPCRGRDRRPVLLLVGSVVLLIDAIRPRFGNGGKSAERAPTTAVAAARDRARTRSRPSCRPRMPLARREPKRAAKRSRGAGRAISGRRSAPPPAGSSRPPPR